MDTASILHLAAETAAILRNHFLLARAVAQPGDFCKSHPSAHVAGRVRTQGWLEKGEKAHIMFHFPFVETFPPPIFFLMYYKF